MRKLLASLLLALVASAALAQGTPGPVINQPTRSVPAGQVTGIIAPANGGTGVANNAASTLTVSGNFGTTLTVTGTTGVTLPTSGTLAKTVSESFTTPNIGAATATSINFGGTSLSVYAENAACTPGIAFGGAAVSVTYTTQVCRTTKIGNRVFVNATVVLSNKGSSTGNATLTGLPYTSNATANAISACTLFADVLTTTAGNQIMAAVPAGVTAVTLYTYGAGTLANMTHLNFNATSQLYVACVYEV